MLQIQSPAKMFHVVQEDGDLILNDNEHASSYNPHIIESLFTSGDLKDAYQYVQFFYSAEMDNALGFAQASGQLPLEQANGASASVALPRKSEQLMTCQRHQQTPGC